MGKFSLNWYNRPIEKSFFAYQNCEQLVSLFLQSKKYGFFEKYPLLKKIELGNLPSLMFIPKACFDQDMCSVFLKRLSCNLIEEAEKRKANLPTCRQKRITINKEE